MLRRCTSIIGMSILRGVAPLFRSESAGFRLSGYLLVLLALVTAHLAGAHSTWALGRPGMKDVRVAAFWVGLPLIGLGLVTRSR